MTKTSKKKDTPGDDAGSTGGWKFSAQWSWAIALMALVLLPRSSGVLQLLVSPQSTYAELRLPMTDKVLVVAKNSGTSKVQLISNKFLTHVCAQIGSDFGFVPSTLGMIPPACYSVAILPTNAAASLSAHVRLDDVEIKPSQLRIMTPQDEMQLAFVSVVVMGGFVWLCLVLHLWWLQDSLKMTGRR